MRDCSIFGTFSYPFLHYSGDALHQIGAVMIDVESKTTSLNTFIHLIVTLLW